MLHNYGSSTPQIDGKTSKKTLYSSLQRYNARISLDGLADRLRRSRLYSTRLLRSVLTLPIYYSIAHCVIHSVVPVAVILYISKCGATFQSCRPIIIYYHTV